MVALAHDNSVDPFKDLDQQESSGAPDKTASLDSASKGGPELSTPLSEPANAPEPASPAKRDDDLTHWWNIPPKLRVLPFVIFGLFRDKEHLPQPLRGMKMQKIPFSVHSPWNGPCDHLNPENWATFEQARDAMLAHAPGTFGLGAVLTPDHPRTCLDVDQKHNPEAFNHAMKMLREDQTAHSWGEVSVSGEAAHIWYVGMFPDGVTSVLDAHSNVEAYCGKRFIALTGRMLGWSTPDLTDGGRIIEQIYSGYAEKRKKARLAAGTTLDGHCYELGRSDMSSERALILLQERKPSSFADLNEPAPQGQGSDRLLRVVGDLDKIIANPWQIFEIIENSPLGQSRCKDLHRKFWNYWLPNARETNTQGIWNRTSAETAMLNEHGKLIAAAMADEDAAYAREASDIVSTFKASRANISQRAIDLWNGLPGGPDVWNKLGQRPPGVAGLLTLTVSNTMLYPFEKYAVPAVLTQFSGVLGRRYKIKKNRREDIRRCKGLSLQVLAGGPTTTGKSEAYEAAADLMNIGIQDGESRQTRMVDQDPKSVEGLISIYNTINAGVFAKDECKPFLLCIMSPRQGTSDAEIEQSVLKLYDQCGHLKYTNETASVAAGKRKATSPQYWQLQNPSISVYLNTVYETLRDTLTYEAVTSGQLARAIVILHNAAAGTVKNYDQRLSVGSEVRKMLTLIRQEADDLDRLYKPVARTSKDDEGKDVITYDPPQIDPEESLVPIFFSDEAAAIRHDVTLYVEQIMQEIDNGTSRYPKHFKCIARLDQNSIRIAGTLAALEHNYSRANRLATDGGPCAFAPNAYPRKCEITAEQYRWAVMYVLQHGLILASNFDSGEVAGTMASDVEAVQYKFSSMIANNKEYREAKMIPCGELHKELKRVKPFKDEKDPGRAVKDACSRMVAEGYFADPRLIKHRFDGSQRAAECYRPQNKRLWSR